MTIEQSSEASRRWTVRVIVYVMLLASAAATFLLHDWLWRTARAGRVPVWIPLVPVVMFTAFVVFYVADRWLLVRRHHYPPIRAFFQVAIAFVFVALLWPRQTEELRRGLEVTGPQPRAARLLSHADAEVRAAACELAGYRGDRALLDQLQALAEHDSSPAVRESCRAATERIRQSETHD